MKTSASLHLLSLDAEDLLRHLGQRISLARRARHLTQPDLAVKTGVGLSTITQIEKGAPTVQIGFYINALWALDLLRELQQAVEQLGRGSSTAVFIEDGVAKKVQPKRMHK